MITRRQIIPRSAGQIFAILSPYESTLRADNGSVPCFPICQGKLLWQPNKLRPLHLSLSQSDTECDIATSVRVNSINDGSMLCENFMKFGPVTPELTLLICERQLRHGQKTGAF